MATFEHPGVKHFDRLRMKQPLAPFAFDGGYSVKVEHKAPPSRVKLPKSFGKWETVPANYFHSANGCNGHAAEVVYESDQYKLEPCDESKTVTYGLIRQQLLDANNADCRMPLEREELPVTYKARLTFNCGDTFYFKSMALAQAGLDELLKLRKTKHPRSKYGSHSPKNDCVPFTYRKIAKYL